jgi:hypothetical protein
MNLWLFDLDGVLIHPGGYREALRRTAAHFSSEAGYPGRRLEESVIETFEAQGITCEWDIAGICVMADIFTLWRASPGLSLPAELESCLRVLRAGSLRLPEPDYAGWARRVNPLGSDTPSASAVKLFRREAVRADPDRVRFREFEAVLDGVLGHPREFARSPMMRYFQQFTLGSREYEKHYRVPSGVETPSLLAELDRPAISDRSRDRILAMLREKKVPIAVITARPSLPGEAEGDLTDYPPEAEIGLAVAGLGGLPVAGAGHMVWLAKRHGEKPDAFLKPSPVHSLAAVSLALGDGEGAALEAARMFVEDGKLTPPLDRLGKEETRIRIFEDSPTGVVGTLSAADLLNGAGLNVHLSIFGVATGKEKRAALQSLGAEVFDTVDRALEAAWKAVP